MALVGRAGYLGPVRASRVPVELDLLCGERLVAEYEVGGLLGDHHDRRVDVPVRDVRHHRGIDDLETVDTVHRHAGRVYDRYLARAHRAGAGRVQCRLAVAPDPIEYLVVGRDRRAWRKLAAVVRVEGRLVQD